MNRRLAAILIADIVGYSRLSQIDEEGTRRRWQQDLETIFAPSIAQHHGRLVKTMGDALLVEYPSVVDAVRSAVAIQRAKAAILDTAPAELRIQLRIGINLGDVIVEGDDIHGEGVNIAHRLQTLAEPGGIAVSGMTYEQVKYRADIGYAFIGEQQVKGIAEPIRVYRVMLDPRDIGKTVTAAAPRSRSWLHPMAAGVLALVAAGGLMWLQPWHLLRDAADRMDQASPPTDKPSIAVLPFDSLSSDASQEYFADGLTDDIITDLSKFSGLFVVARNSSFSFKGMTLPIPEIAQKLGVRYVLDGSVRHAGEEVRINARLTDGRTDGQVWADRYDGSEADIFALQDKVSNGVADALSIVINSSEQAALAAPETQVPVAYDAFLQGWHHREQTNPTDFAKAIPYFENAVRLDPNYSRAYAALALIYLRSYQRGWTRQLNLSDDEALRLTREYLAKAAARPTSTSHQVAGLLAISSNDLDGALNEFDQAVALDAADSWSLAYTSLVQILKGDVDAAASAIDGAMRLDPIAPPLFHYYKGLVLYTKEDYAAAAKELETATARNPGDQMPFLLLAAAYGQLDRKAEAAVAIDRFNDLEAAYGTEPASIQLVAKRLRFRNAADSDRLYQGLRLAGVPDS
ncbi:MAG: adenylate/guanylate cyclase domain-containing protein [Dongiaceae bacterium]